MKRFKLFLQEKGSNFTSAIFVNANTEAEARQYFENNFTRFNNLLSIKEVK